MLNVFRWRLLALMMVSLMLAAGAVACDDGVQVTPKDGTTNGDVPDTGDNGEGTVDPDLINPDGETVVPNCPPTPCPGPADPWWMLDSDGDGIRNLFEDKNQNCIVDAGETNPCNSDSDGDTIPDGDEDINRNGVYEPHLGETDPTNPSDPTPDRRDRDVVCNASLLEQISSVPVSGANSNVALPSSYQFKHFANAGAAFSDPGRGLYGFIVQTKADTTNATTENNKILVKAALGPDGTPQSGDENLPRVEFTKGFAVPSAEWVEPFNAQFLIVPTHTGVRALVGFDYGPGSPNAGVAQKDPAQLRDELMTSITGQALSSEMQGTPCTNIRAAWHTALRDADNADTRSMVTTVLLTCENNLNGPGADPTVAFDFADVDGGTVVAPGRYSIRSNFLCEDRILARGGGQVDFLWVIDNSGSMADEQANVAATASMFMDRLVRSGVDWRVAVTTTEAYQLFTGNAPCETHADCTGYLQCVNKVCAVAGSNLITRDEMLDHTTGLRGHDGFLTQSETASATFFDLVTRDENCLQTWSFIHANVCGHGWEEGLLSGVQVLNALKVDDRPHFQLRPAEETTRVVIWVSDEENQSFKVNRGGTLVTLTPEDPEFETILNGFVAGYAALGVKGYAIVGDQGKDAGGVCELLDTSNFSATEGAEPGNSYIKAAEALGGAVASICSDNLSATVQRIIDDTIGMASSYPLKGYPITSSIRVAIGEEVIPRGDPGWSYNADTNSIVFFGLPFTSVENMTIAYLLWEFQAG